MRTGGRLHPLIADAQRPLSSWLVRLALNGHRFYADQLKPSLFGGRTPSDISGGYLILMG